MAFSKDAPKPGAKHQILVDEFMELDKLCSEMIDKVRDGRILFDCIPPEGAASLQEFMDKMKFRWEQVQDNLRTLIEKRNAKLQEVSTELRGLVMAKEDQVRGIDGKADVQTVGPFKVMSKTFRGLDKEILFPKLQELGLFSRLQEITYVDKDSGKMEPAVKQEWEIRYEPVKNWLRESNLEGVLEAAYEEEEGTPSVTGPKPLSFFGDEKKKG